MKKLLQEDLLDAGYQLPDTGLCYNLDPEDAKALISEGNGFSPKMNWLQRRRRATISIPYSIRFG